MTGFITVDGAHYLLNLMTAGETALNSYYLALINGASPGISAYGTELEEPSDSGYQRSRYENLSGNWMIVNGVLQNVYQISFVSPLVSWGYVRHWALCESIDGGRVFAAGDINPILPLVGDVLYFPAGSITLEFSLASWTALT